MSANSRLTTAVHALCWLELAARRGYPSLTSERVAASLASNPALVRKALGPLRDAGLVTSGRGPGAGWSLARPAARIRLDQVYDALGEEPPYALHAHTPNQDCPVGFGIRPVLSDVYADADAAIRRSLAAAPSPTSSTPCSPSTHSPARRGSPVCLGRDSPAGTTHSHRTTPTSPGASCRCPVPTRGGRRGRAPRP